MHQPSFYLQPTRGDNLCGLHAVFGPYLGKKVLRHDNFQYELDELGIHSIVTSMASFFKEELLQTYESVPDLINTDLMEKEDVISFKDKLLDLFYHQLQDYDKKRMEDVPLFLQNDHKIHDEVKLLFKEKEDLDKNWDSTKRTEYDALVPLIKNTIRANWSMFMEAYANDWLYNKEHRVQEVDLQLFSLLANIDLEIVSLKASEMESNYYRLSLNDLDIVKRNKISLPENKFKKTIQGRFPVMLAIKAWSSGVMRHYEVIDYARVHGRYCNP